MRVLFAGGGTAGHINPALAIAGCIRSRRPEAVIAFAGTPEGMESTLVPKEGYPVYPIDVRGFKRKLSLYNVGAAWRSVTSLFEAKKIIQEFRPDVVVGTGGYVSGPVLLMAAKMNIPTVIHEQNAYPGATSKALSKKVDRVFISFEESRQYFACDPQRLELVGNPVREEMIFCDREKAKAELGLPNKPFVLSFAGSLGAREINKTILDFLEIVKDKQDFAFLHATGTRGYLWMPEKIRERGIDLEKLPDIRIEKYIYNMPTVMAAADLIVCRAGAITLSELAVMHKAAVLIPSPNVAHNHQYYNALAFEKAGAARMILESDLTGQVLYDTITELLGDRRITQNMEEAVSKLAIYDSTTKIYEAICQFVAK